MTDSATHTVDGVERPAPGTWHVDAGHTDAAFIGRHLGLSKVRGRFTGVEGTVEIAEDITQSRVEIWIDVASVDSGAHDRDASLRSENYFDVANHAEATFRSTDIRADGSNGTITGDLTIKGVARPVTLDVEYLGHARDPWGNDRVAFSAAATIKREDWGLALPMAMDGDGILVSKEIRLEIQTELIRSRARG